MFRLHHAQAAAVHYVAICTLAMCLVSDNLLRPVQHTYALSYLCLYPPPKHNIDEHKTDTSNTGNTGIHTPVSALLSSTYLRCLVPALGLLVVAVAVLALDGT